MQAQPLQYIEQVGIPIGSANETGIHVSRYMGEMSSEEYLVHIHALTDQMPSLATRKHYHIAFAYLCQNMVRQNDKLGAVDPIICLGLALDTVKKHEKIHSFMFLEDATPAEGSRNVVDGITRPQGWKRQQAIQFMKDNRDCTRQQFIQHCVDNLEMTQAGSQSYYYMAYEDVHGKKPPKGKKGRVAVEGAVSRKDQAIQLYRDLLVDTPDLTRAQFIHCCVDNLGMTVAGATTYWYVAYEQVNGGKPPKMARGKSKEVIG